MKNSPKKNKKVVQIKLLLSLSRTQLLTKLVLMESSSIPLEELFEAHLPLPRNSM